MTYFKKGLLDISVYPDRATLGIAAWRHISTTIKKLLNQQDYVNIVFGAAPSQNETLAALANDKTIDWSRVRAFHMDEYVGLAPDSPQLFGRYLHEHFFDKVALRDIFLIDGSTNDTAGECARYATLLDIYQTDIVCLGIGENTHIAFNDPHVADFDDYDMVKVVQMDEECRLQQVHDGCFPTLDAVPEQAITLTIPALFRAKYAFCMVPGKRKADAVHLTLTTPLITPTCPASILREHPAASLFLDADSASKLSSFEALSGMNSLFR
jgi:glucosamine-6-phosphate deaminase